MVNLDWSFQLFACARSRFFCAADDLLCVAEGPFGSASFGLLFGLLASRCVGVLTKHLENITTEQKAEATQVLPHSNARLLQQRPSAKKKKKAFSKSHLLLFSTGTVGGIS